MDHWRNRPVWLPISVGGLVVLAFLLLLMRNSGVIPFVFMDEYAYSMSARLTPMATSILPNYLYYAAFRTTNACGAEFLSCARGLNAVFFLSAAPFIFLTARRVAGMPAAALVALMTVLGPLNSYTVYFMPEACYFLGFWMATWVALGAGPAYPLSRWGWLGLVVGLMSLVKPHGLFLLPALCVFVAYVRLRVSLAALRDTAVSIAVLLVVTMVTKLGVGYLLAGPSGVTLFGSLYNGVAQTSVQGLGHYAALAGFALTSLGRHFMIVVYIFGLGMVAAVVLVVNGGVRQAARTQASVTAMYTLLMMGSLLCMTALLTGSLAVASGAAETTRVHQRYYDFAIPLLMIAAASLLRTDMTTASRRVGAILAGVLAGVVVYVFVSRLRGFHLGVLDAPWAFGIGSNRGSFRTMGYVTFVILVAWPFVPRVATLVFFWCVIPLSTAVAAHWVNRDLDGHREPQVYERAATAARLVIPADERGSLVVIVTYASQGYQTLFTVDSADATFMVKPEHESPTWQELPAGKDWVLTIGDHPLPTGAIEQTHMPGFSLGRMPRDTAHQ